MKNIIRVETNSRRSRAVVCNGVAYLSGQFADDEGLDIRGQTRQVLEKIDRLLVTVGSDKSLLLTAQIWLKNIRRDFQGMNEVWDAWAVSGDAPTRATAQCEMATPGMLIEIVVSAAIGPSNCE